VRGCEIKHKTGQETDMPIYAVRVLRTYTSKHVHERTVEADTPDAASAWVEAELQAEAFDPSEEYEEHENGYSECGDWYVSVVASQVAIAPGQADTRVEK